MELAKYWDGTNPTACAQAGNATIDTKTIARTGTDTLLATVEIKHSPKCHTTWVRVTNTLEGATVAKKLERQSDGALPAFEREDKDLSKDFEIVGNNISFSMQVYAPSCVVASVQIVDASGAIAGSLPSQSFCSPSPPA
ncbi:DUF2690 domain-containing protein [Pseudarthrobacter defluvii]|uniref:DUF2690 domain-containing protein n=1 Tax=Pseudarthrobacter defluvii TaxID=410837 RepID=UPI002578EFB2|nr:DUF2690 domain-containing protein [Pseudarthrobacter defluvii]WJH26709.1 DUF2690 domain-containing protein [Pseudarthrobacter defluvii]